MVDDFSDKGQPTAAVDFATIDVKSEQFYVNVNVYYLILHHIYSDTLWCCTIYESI